MPSEVTAFAARLPSSVVYPAPSEEYPAASEASPAAFEAFQAPFEAYPVREACPAPSVACRDPSVASQVPAEVDQDSYEAGLDSYEARLLFDFRAFAVQRPLETFVVPFDCGSRSSEAGRACDPYSLCGPFGAGRPAGG